ncbi:MAG: aldehyde dehydrogenase family protein [Clostridia bacterium]
MLHYKCLINGELVNSSDEKIIEVFNPYNGELVGTIPAGTKEDVTKILKSADVAQKAWARLPALTRAKYVSELAEILEENREELSVLLTAEHGKTIKDSNEEIDASISLLNFAAQSATRIEGEHITSEKVNEEAWIQRVPYGVVVGIVAWNFPLALSARKIGNALVCGNSMIIKPPSETPLTVMRFAELIAEKNSIPKGVLSFITGSGRIVGDALVRNDITKLVTLTGSTGAGIEVFKAAAENVVVPHLELGGKAPFIVMDDADVEKAARCAVIAKFTNCGQICTCNERMYVHEKVYDEFKEKFLKYTSEVVVGNPMDKNTSMGPKVSMSEVKKLLEIKEEAKAQGGKLLLDMTPEVLPTENGNWFYPTVFEVESNDNVLMKTEIFGPMLAMMKISSLEQAIEYSNDCEYGLSAYLFSDSSKNIMTAMRELEFGEIYVNRENGELVNGFHNGYKKSGLGGEDGKHGLEGYLQKKMIYVNFNY